jgi:hypothetical protein
MANRCYNFIEINGSEEEIKEFLSHLELNDTQEDGCEVYENLINKFSNGEIQDNARWFDVEVDQIEDNPQYLKIHGDSAWVPCTFLFVEISKKYPTFKIRYEYEEQGFDFAGWTDIENGQMQDNCFTYWEGLVAMNSQSALDNAISNELGCYDNVRALKTSDMFKAFDQEQQNEILKAYSETEI